MQSSSPRYKCWFINEEERLQALKNGKPYDRPHSVDYFELTNRIDDIFIEGHIVREEDIGARYVNDVRHRLTYLIDYQDKKKVYFTFDGISLYQLVEFFPGFPNPIKFMLKRLDELKNVKLGQAFMIMPFGYPELNDFYNSHIKSYLNGALNINIYRADDILDNDIIVDTIYKLIEQSEFLIAETTHANKNVFYELGYAAALQKEIITIQHQNEQDLFFDRRHIRSIMYDENNIPTFHASLNATIQSIRARM
mgnify:CR=1 FL=1